MSRKNEFYQMTTEEAISQEEIYTDSTGTNYKKSSIHLYTDKDGKLRSFSDDTKKEIKYHEDSIKLYKEWIYRSLNSPYGEDKSNLVNMYRKWISDSEKRLVKLYKDLERGF